MELAKLAYRAEVTHFGAPGGKHIILLYDDIVF